MNKRIIIIQKLRDRWSPENAPKQDPYVKGYTPPTREQSMQKVISMFKPKYEKMSKM